MIFWHNSCFSVKNLAFKMALISESRAQRGQIEKIRPLLLLKLFEDQERKWPYFFNFRPLSLRNDNKGQNQGQSSGAHNYGLLVIFFGWQAGFWYDLPSHKVSYVSMDFKCPKNLNDGLLKKWTLHFSSIFSTFGLYFLQKMSTFSIFFFWLQIRQ